MDHTADVRLRASGKDLDDLFRNAALGLFSLMSDVSAVNPRESRRLKASGTDLESLLVSLLSEILYQFEVTQTVFSDIRICSLTNDPFEVEALAGGERYEPSRHPLRSHIKGVSYHGLWIEHGESWTAEIVLDV